jgi:sporulation protein YlmC with PRC-barrel domain
MRFSDAIGRKIVSTATAETAGKIDEFIVDPHNRTVVALELKKSDGGDFLPWSGILAFGDDAVTIASADKITDASPQIAELTGKEHRVLGKRVLSTAGDDLGQVADVEFDPATGLLTALRLETDSVDGGRLVGIGSYAVVVADA